MFILPQIKELQIATLSDINGNGTTVLPSGAYRNITGNFTDISDNNTAIYCLNFNGNILSINASSSNSYVASSPSGTIKNLLISQNADTSFTMSKGNNGGQGGGGGGGAGGGGGGSGAGGDAYGNTPENGKSGNNGQVGLPANGVIGGAGGAGGSGVSGGLGADGGKLNPLSSGEADGGSRGAAGLFGSGGRGGDGEDGSSSRPGGAGGAGGSYPNGGGQGGKRGTFRTSNTTRGVNGAGGGGGGGALGKIGENGQNGLLGSNGSNPSKSLYLLIYNKSIGSIKVDSNMPSLNVDDILSSSPQSLGGKGGQGGAGSNGHSSKIDIFSRHFINSFTDINIPETIAKSFIQYTNGISPINFNYFITVNRTTVQYVYPDSTSLSLIYYNQTKGIDGLSFGNGAGATQVGQRGSGGTRTNGPSAGDGNPGTSGTMGGNGAKGTKGIGANPLTTAPIKIIRSY